ncbi:MAG: hypothetical protein V4819_23395 [Verrucomicrobiota bacterium]
MARSPVQKRSNTGDGQVVDKSSGPKRMPGRNVYEIVLRESGGATLTAKVLDSVLYPKALAWTRLLSSDRGRQVDVTTEDESWRKRGLDTLHELAAAGKVAPGVVDAFIKAVGVSGVVQVELPWEKESIGYAARVFPWEQLIALATKDERMKQGNRPITVVRFLKGAESPHARPAPRTGAVFAITNEAAKLGYHFDAEHGAIQAALAEDLPLLTVASLDEIPGKSGVANPRHLHLVVEYCDTSESLVTSGKEATNEQIAGAVAAIGPELVVYSACYTGKRLAPLTVAKGVKVAIGFHGIVMEPSLPVFFGAFYQVLRQQADVLAAMRAGLAANDLQPIPGDLGAVVLWSAESLITTPAAAARSMKAPPDATEKNDAIIAAGELEAALPVSCTIEETLNYSVLHNSRGGLFKTFVITKVKEGKLEHPVEITVSLDTGLDRPVSCRYCLRKPFETSPQHDLAASIILPLGSQLLRQRGETILGTVEVTIKCGPVQIFHEMQPIKLLPCDEWRDDETGRHLLPSFIFPRDPSVREVITTAQPYLRALRDEPQGGFDGYQQDSTRAVILQTRAIWSALQHTYRLDYVNPPPTYTKSSQRLRTPEEIFRAKRGTCIELALMLAACWEHVGILPVIFLTRGHAFAGFWTSSSARLDFIVGLANLMQHAETVEPTEAVNPAKIATLIARSTGAGGLLRRVLAEPLSDKTATTQGRNDGKVKEPWMFAEDHHLSAIRSAVEDGALVPLETTYIPLQRPYAESLRDAGDLLAQVPPPYFDGMLDVQSAREKGVTPLSIIFQGIVA